MDSNTQAKPVKALIDSIEEDIDTILDLQNYIVDREESTNFKSLEGLKLTEEEGKGLEEVLVRLREAVDGLAVHSKAFANNTSNLAEEVLTKANAPVAGKYLVIDVDGFIAENAGNDHLMDTVVSPEGEVWIDRICEARGRGYVGYVGHIELIYKTEWKFVKLVEAA